MTNEHEELPVVTAEDVEFSEEYADMEDKEAAERAKAADKRATGEGAE
ncbi:YfhD family protein [Cohnella boryungensis]|uniref:YfhD family protein n=1 Tax=Cohnella boryungensis TaxID=768479 RepID=A0ABV8SFC1_9BACL